MSTHTFRMALAEAQAAHGGDRSTLLAAIDQLAAQLESKQTTTSK